MSIPSTTPRAGLDDKIRQTLDAALFHAIKETNNDSAHAAVTAGADPDLLLNSACANNIGTATHALDAGGNPDIVLERYKAAGVQYTTLAAKYNPSPDKLLEAAVRHDLKDIFDQAVLAGARTDTKKMDPETINARDALLLEALEEKDLARRDTRIDLAFAAGARPVFLLSRGINDDNPGLLKLAVEKGASPDGVLCSPNGDFLPAIHFTLEKPDCAKMLIALGANIDAPGWNGKTCLLRALESVKSGKNLAPAELFATSGANPLIPDAGGVTALGYYLENAKEIVHMWEGGSKGSSARVRSLFPAMMASAAKLAKPAVPLPPSSVGIGSNVPVHKQLTIIHKDAERKDNGAAP